MPTPFNQAMIVTALSSVHRNLFVVGDDAQGIYSFRGADSRNILRFPDNRPSCAVIANMREKFAKRLFTSLPDGPKPLLCAARNEAEEARWIIAKIRELIISGAPAAEIAVLHRQGLHAYKFELELASAGLHYEKWGGLKLTEDPARLRDLNRVHALAADYDDLRSFVDDFALNRPDPAAADQGLNLIASTIHSAKGKEFDAVFVLGLAEHRFPFCGQTEAIYEEEQRLFYVACTRARRQLFLTWPEMIITPDRKHRLCEVSPFIRGIDPALFDTVEA